MEQDDNREFILVDKKEEAENITSLFFKPTSGSKYKYIPGQYVNIRPLGVQGHGKSYTISSTQSEKFVCITVKRKGVVSSALVDLRVGDKLILEGPYGNFYPENNVKDIVMIAGGIGITPFYSVIKSKLESKNNKNKILLIYSNKTTKETPFFEELINLEKNSSLLKVVYCLTQEKKRYSQVKEYSRIDKKILKKYIASVDNKCYYVCGSISFVDDMWRALKGVGVPEECIFTESFF